MSPGVRGKGRVSPELKRYYELLSSDADTYLRGNRTRSTAFLAWFLENVFRIDPVLVDDAICDGGGDKGIDALLVDSSSKEVVLFQAKHFQSAGKTQGENDLKALVGAARYFRTPQSLEKLLAARPNRELRRLITRNEVHDLLSEGGHSLRLVLSRAGSSVGTHAATRPPAVPRRSR